MALYYSAAGRTQTFSASRSTSEARPNTGTSPSEDWEGSFYIFPNPPSLPPTSPFSQFSDLSTPSEEALPPTDNVIAPSPSFNRRRTGETNPLEPQDVAGVWDWPKEGAFASASNSVRHLSLHHSKAERKPLDSAGIASQLDDEYPAAWSIAREQSRDAFGLSKDRSPSPPPRIHIPLLSFFAPLLSIDDSTLDLLTASACRGSSPEELVEEKLLQEGIVNIGDLMHGVEKLLSVESDETFIFRSAMLSSKLDTSSSPLIRLSDVLEIITGIGGDLFRIVTWRVDR
ncbi:hypothetical protein MD484_g1201, partial [Candolleomyces efflorescens]